MDHNEDNGMHDDQKLPSRACGGGWKTQCVVRFVEESDLEAMHAAGHGCPGASHAVKLKDRTLAVFSGACLPLCCVYFAVENTSRDSFRAWQSILAFCEAAGYAETFFIGQPDSPIRPFFERLGVFKYESTECYRYVHGWTQTAKTASADASGQ